MPSAYTHQLIAEDALSETDGVTDSGAFFFGAQGPDPMFFYRFISMRGVSPGKLLHRTRIYEGFEAMRLYCAARPAAMSYALGCVSHYAADTVFHPFVYWLSHTEGGTHMDRNITHTRVEREFDTYFLYRLRGIRMHEYRLPYCAKDVDASVVTGVLGAALRTGGLVLDEDHVRRAINGWFAFLRNTYDRRGVRRRISDAIACLGIKPFGLLSALFSRPYFDERSLNLGREEWYNILDPSVVCRDGADDLYARAVRRTIELTGIFLRCASFRSPLPPELFSDNLLTGLPEALGDIDSVYGETRDYRARLAKYLQR